MYRYTVYQVRWRLWGVCVPLDWNMDEEALPGGTRHCPCRCVGTPGEQAWDHGHAIGHGICFRAKRFGCGPNWDGCGAVKSFSSCGLRIQVHCVAHMDKLPTGPKVLVRSRCLDADTAHCLDRWASSFSEIHRPMDAAGGSWRRWILASCLPPMWHADLQGLQWVHGGLLPHMPMASPSEAMLCHGLGAWDRVDWRSLPWRSKSDWASTWSGSFGLRWLVVGITDQWSAWKSQIFLWPLRRPKWQPPMPSTWSRQPELENGDRLTRSKMMKISHMPFPLTIRQFWQEERAWQQHGSRSGQLKKRDWCQWRQRFLQPRGLVGHLLSQSFDQCQKWSPEPGAKGWGFAWGRMLALPQTKSPIERKSWRANCKAWVLSSRRAGWLLGWRRNGPVHAGDSVSIWWLRRSPSPSHMQWPRPRSWERSWQNEAGGFPGFVDLDSYLHDSTATSAPCRALNALKWLNKNGQLGWDLQGLSAPTAGSKREAKSRQAVVVAPPMMPFLEEQIEKLYGIGDPRWSALLASWLMASGCLRYRHLTRSNPRRLTRSTFHLSCTKGKQRRLRQGFNYCVPSHFSTGWDWSSPLLQAIHRLPAEQQKRCGLCFDQVGNPWAIREVTLVCREVFHGQIDEVEWLTTYSWRRWSSTVAHTLKLSPSEGAALGDWQNRKDLPQEARMPLHYSGARYTQSMRVKHLVHAAASQLQGFESWDLTTEQAAKQAVKQARLAVDKAIQHDKIVVWSLPITTDEARERFSLAAALRDRAAKARRAAANLPAAKSMPDSIQGKQLSSFLKSGALLCGAYQLQRCSLSEDACTGRHQCAVTFKSGRVCGGQHPASLCWNRRAATVSAPSGRGTPVGEPTTEHETSSRPPEPLEPPKAKKQKRQHVAKAAQPKAEVIQLEEEQENTDSYFDYMAGGKHRHDQAPTAIYVSQAGGTLWLGPLPTEETKHKFPKVTLQVTCFSDPPHTKGGVVLPGVMHIYIAPSAKRDRVNQWRVQWPLIKNTLFAGESVLLHCLAGRHRAAGVGMLVRAVLANESLEDSEAYIKAKRDVDVPGLMRDRSIGVWVAEMKRTTQVTPGFPKVVGCIATAKSKLHLMTVGEIPLCSHKQSTDRAADRLVNPLKTQDFYEAAAWQRPTCEACLGRAPAGLQVLFRALWPSEPRLTKDSVEKRDSRE